MRVFHLIGYFIILLAVGVPMLAQQPAPAATNQTANVPTLSPVQQAELTAAVLTIENRRLLLQLAEAEFREYVRTLDQPGYQLVRQPSGTWEYVTAPPKSE